MKIQSKAKLLASIFSVTLLVSLSAHADQGGSGDGKMQKVKAKMTERFNEADANHDGQLTLDEAKSKMPRVAKNFDQIDTDKKGYVTLDQITAFAAEKMQDRDK